MKLGVLVERVNRTIYGCESLGHVPRGHMTHTLRDDLVLRLKALEDEDVVSMRKRRID